MVGLFNSLNIVNTEKSKIEGIINLITYVPPNLFFKSDTDPEASNEP